MVILTATNGLTAALPVVELLEEEEGLESLSEGGEETEPEGPLELLESEESLSEDETSIGLDGGRKKFLHLKARGESRKSFLRTAQICFETESASCLALSPWRLIMLWTFQIA